MIGVVQKIEFSQKGAKKIQIGGVWYFTGKTNTDAVKVGDGIESDRSSRSSVRIAAAGRLKWSAGMEARHGRCRKAWRPVPLWSVRLTSCARYRTWSRKRLCSRHRCGRLPEEFLGEAGLLFAAPGFHERAAAGCESAPKDERGG